MNSLVKRDPISRLFAWPKWMDEFEDVSSKGLKVHETDNEIVAEGVVAGVPAKDVEVTIEDGVLTIKAERKDTKKEGDSYESSSYNYYYTLALPSSLGEWDKATAETENGVITVKIPKAKAAKPQKITVKSKEK